MMRLKLFFLGCVFMAWGLLVWPAWPEADYTVDNSLAGDAGGWLGGTPVLEQSESLTFTEPTIGTCTCFSIEAPTVPLALASFMEQWVMPMRCELLSLNCETLYALTIDVAGERVFSLEMMPKPKPGKGP